MQQTRQWHVQPETALNPLDKEQFKGNVFDYCSYTVPVKCKLTVTRNSNDSTWSSILETFKYQVSSWDIRVSSRVVQVSSRDVTCTVLFISIVTNSRNKSFSQKILRASWNSKLDTRDSILDSQKYWVSRIKFQIETVNLHLNGTVVLMFKFKIKTLQIGKFSIYLQLLYEFCKTEQKMVK